MQRSVVQNLPSSAGAKPLVGTGDFSFDINLSVSILIKAESRTNAATLILHIRCPFSGQRFPGVRFPDSANRSEEHTSELQSHLNLVCRLLLEKKKTK